jgi:hypothetical protein
MCQLLSLLLRTRVLQQQQQQQQQQRCFCRLRQLCMMQILA